VEVSAVSSTAFEISPPYPSVLSVTLSYHSRQTSDFSPLSRFLLHAVMRDHTNVITVAEDIAKALRPLCSRLQSLAIRPFSFNAHLSTPIEMVKCLHYLGSSVVSTFSFEVVYHGRECINFSSATSIKGYATIDPETRGGSGGGGPRTLTRKVGSLFCHIIWLILMRSLFILFYFNFLQPFGAQRANRKHEIS
jgi:hypothetical protein